MISDDSRQDPARQFPGRTTPTWEIELLLSGATVFALMQLAGALPEWGGYLLPRLSALWQQVVGLGLIYFQSGVLLLCVAFVLHLMLRAYWVALVGMDSVYPGGLKPGRLRGGPIGRDWVLQRWMPMSEQIERADNNASIVFGLGIGLARVMVYVTFFGTFTLLVSLGLAAALGQPEDAGTWVTGLVMLVFGPYLLVMAVDRYLGHQLKPGGWAYRTIRAVHAANSRMGFGRESSPLVVLYTTNVGEDRGNWIVGGLVGLAAVASFLTLDTFGDDLGPGAYGEFPALSVEAASTIGHVHYASQHEPGESPRSPFLPDMQARGRYLPLVVPYLPVRHRHLLRYCQAGGTDTEDPDSKPADSAALLGCLAGGFQVTLDGEPLAVSPELYSDARRDLRGLLYMIPLDDQSRGRHELVIVLTPDVPPADGEPPPTWRIPYWY